jgi:periplasmic divalent cation tolerance protein
MTDYRVALTTTGTEEEARRLARELVERKLAACVNIVPQVESVYRWQGKIESAQEWLLVIKTRADVLDRLQAAIRELHSYEVPEFVVLRIESGSEEYLRWIGECLN